MAALVDRQGVVAERLASTKRKARRLRDFRQRQCIQRSDAVGADRLRPAQQPDLVGEAGRDKGRRHAAAALHHQPGDALFRRAHAARPADRARGPSSAVCGSPARPPPRASPRPGLPRARTPPPRAASRGAERTSRLSPGMRKDRSSTTRTGERAAMPGKRQVRSGSSARTVPIPTRMASLCARSRCTRVRAASPVMATGLWPLAAILSSLDTASFRITCGRLIANAAEMPGMVVRGFLGKQADIDGDAGGAKFCVPLACDFGIGILDRCHHARNARGDDRVRTGWRFAEMRTGLERDIKCRASRCVACTSERFRLGMRAAARLRPAAADDDAVFHHDRADGRVWPGPAQPAPAERERELHETPVGFLVGPGFFPELIFQDAEDHLRIVTILASSSPESSPSTASKSLASRKLR